MENDPEIQQILRLLSDVENLTNTEQEHLLKLGTKKYVQHRLNKGHCGDDGNRAGFRALPNQLTWRIKMKKTRTITIDPEQYKALLEYSQRSGQPVKDAINEALEDYIADAVSPKLRASDSQGQ
jgi:hypothetical protein